MPHSSPNGVAPVLKRTGVCVLTALLAGPMLPRATAGPQSQSAAGAGQTSAAVGRVSGVASNRDGTPIVRGRLRLRDTTTGQVVSTVESDAEGRFDFDRVPQGRYLVELLDEHGAVKAVGRVFPLAPGESVTVSLAAGAPAGWYRGMFTSAALAAVAAAAALGITTMGDGGQPASPRF